MLSSNRSRRHSPHSTGMEWSYKMPASISRRLGRVRPPRVHITYDIEIDDSIEKREIPFVVGVLTDLSGNGAFSKPMRNRNFIEIDRDNFDSVMAKICPELSLEVPNRLTADQVMLSV